MAWRLDRASAAPPERPSGPPMPVSQEPQPLPRPRQVQWQQQTPPLALVRQRQPWPAGAAVLGFANVPKLAQSPA